MTLGIGITKIGKNILVLIMGTLTTLFFFLVAKDMAILYLIWGIICFLLLWLVLFRKFKADRIERANSPFSLLIASIFPLLGSALGWVACGYSNKIGSYLVTIWLLVVCVSVAFFLGLTKKPSNSEKR